MKSLNKSLGLGPDREFLPLPPAPEGRSVHRSAKDTDVDIFAELLEASEKPKSEENETSKEPEPQKEEKASKKAEEEEKEEEHPLLGPSKSSEPVLPAWRAALRRGSRAGVPSSGPLRVRRLRRCRGPPRFVGLRSHEAPRVMQGSLGLLFCEHLYGI